MLYFVLSQNSYASCGATSSSFVGSNPGHGGQWANGLNWNTGIVPSSTNDAVIGANSFGDPIVPTTAVSCFTVNSGTALDGGTAITLSITGDIFYAPYLGSINFTNAATVISMDGSVPQTFTAVDTIQNITATNTSTVSYGGSFRLNNNWVMPSSGTTYITGVVTLTKALTIPAGHTVIIQNKAKLYLDNGVTINGTLTVQGGGELYIANAKTLSVATGGTLYGVGSAGNPAHIYAYDSVSLFNFNVSGSISANYLVVSGIDNGGMGINISGTVLQFKNTDIRGMKTNSITLGTAAAVPAIWDYIGFYDDRGYGGTKNFSVTTLPNGATINMTNFSGNTSGQTKEAADTNNLISWGTPAPTTLGIINNAGSGVPTTSTSASTTQPYAAYSFSLNQSDVATNITQVNISMIGTASISDLASVKAYRDVNANCVYDAGGDTQIGSNLIFSGSPPKATITIPTGNLQTNSSNSTAACLLIVATTSASPSNGKTVQFSIASTSDLSNDQNYSISTTSGTPSLNNSTTLLGTPDAVWIGAGTGVNQNFWSTGNHWSTGATPNNTKNCQVGSGSSIATIDVSPVSCNNASLNSGGTLDFNLGANIFQVYGTLIGSASYNFLNAASGVIKISGATNQGFSLPTAFPGSMVIANTGVAGTNQVDLLANSTVNGTLTCTSGLLNIGNGMTLTVLGNVTIQAGCTINIASGGTLALGNGSVLTVNSGGTLSLIGSAALNALVTSNAPNAAYTVVINGTIKAQNYQFDHLGTNGVIINSGATIDSTYYLQNGIFTYPVNNGTTFLTLNRQIPVGKNLSYMNFASNGSAATGVKSVNTGTAPAGTLVISNYSGDLSGGVAGLNYTIGSGPYDISWSSQSNTISITREATTPASLTAGLTYNMGRFGFKQDAAGAYADTNITSLNITLIGSGNANDISAVRLYSDPTCVGANGTLIGTTVFNGYTAIANFNITSGNLVVPFNATTTVKVCAYVEFDISSSATNSGTLGVSITNGSDFVNSESYIASSTFPVTLGTPGIITVPPSTTWKGTTSSAWALAANWSNGIPSPTIDCTIPVVGTNYPIVSTSGQSCHSLTMSGGTLTINAGINLDIYQDYSFSIGTLNNSGSITIQDSAGNNHYLNYVPTLSSLNFNTNGIVYINNSSTTITALGTMSAGTIIDIPGARKLILPNGYNLSSGTIKIEAGGTLAIGNGQTLSIGTGATLALLGNSTSNANVISSSAPSGAYNVTVNSGATIKAQYYEFDNLNTNGAGVFGLTINSGAIIDPTYHLQNGVFSYPVGNNGALLKLNIQVPTNTLAGMSFLTNGSSATNVQSINSGTAPAGTLTLSSYSGNLAGGVAGVNYTNGTGPYSITWAAPTNTIAITQEATTPASLTAGLTYTVGRFGFKQNTTGAIYSDANVTSLNVTLLGTATASDVGAVRIYSDPSCAGTGGTLIGTGSFSGTPAKARFTINSGSLIVPHNATTTVKVCTYVQYDISSSAIATHTAGASIAAASDFVNDLTYAASNTFPLTLGTSGTITVPSTTTWTGGASTTAWATAGNWSAGVPTSSLNCVIAAAAFNPTISTTGPACNSITISGGTLTINAASSLDIYQDFTYSSGTLINNGTLTIQNNGGNNHYIVSSLTIPSMNFSANGIVYMNNASTTITTLGTLSSTTTLDIPTGMKLILPNGYSLTAGTIKIEKGGILDIGNTKTFAINGGTFQVSGVNAVLPHTAANLGLIEPQGGIGSYAFTANSGTVNLIGFQFDKVDVNGLNFPPGSSANLTNLTSGQFTNLNATQASVKAIQLNTSGTIPATAANIAWTWGSLNNFTATANTPASAIAYTLVSGASGCNNQTITFTGWDGDWFSSQATFDVTTKIVGKLTAPACTIIMSGAASAVSLLSFTAVGYDSAVDVKWETNLERTHLGFNVYRTTATSDRFLQVNKTLIRNLKTSSSNKGTYRFIDNDVINNQNYYYYLEDIDIYGHGTIHGPVFVAPMAMYGAPPPDGLSQNSNSNTATTPTTGTPSTIANPSYQDLGNGIVILSQTSSSLRIEITPPTPTYSTNAWNSFYQDVVMASYSKMTSIGNAELPEKDILIEVQSFATTAIVNKIITIQNSSTGHYIVPAPSYSINGSGVLIPHYAVNSTYGNDALYPAQAEFFSIENNLITMNDKKYLKLKVNPMKMNGFTGVIKMASKITIDVGLDGDDWNVAVPNVNSNLSVYSVANTLRIDAVQNGIYQLNYSDFVNSQVEGPFNATDITKWRLYLRNTEIPLEVYSPTGSFTFGDYIRFYVPFNPSTESKSNQLILSPINLTAASISPKRMAFIDSNSAGSSPAGIFTTFTKILEQNLVYVDGFSLSDNLDHYFYKNLYSAAGGDFNVTTTLPEIDATNIEDVTIKLHVRGELGIFDVPVTHRLQLTVGGIVQGEAIFNENTRNILTFKVPSSNFIAGNNVIGINLPGTFATVGDYDRVLLDKIEIIYRGNKVNSTGVASVMIPGDWGVYRLEHFSSAEVFGYDITDSLAPKRLSNLTIGLDSSAITYGVNFFVPSYSGSAYNKYFVFAEGNSYYKPSGLSLTPGSNVSLKNSSNEADLVIYGDENLLNAVADLIALRTSQGLLVKTVTPTEVYSEFSYGVASSDAVRNFINTARTNWNRPPRYFLILGDGTNDPLNYNVSGVGAPSAVDRGTLPAAPIIVGQYGDFFGDNFFVSTSVSHLPQMAVGRIPTNNANKIKAYIEKIIRYETGDAAPSSSLKNLSFIADQDTPRNFEHFNQWSQAMMSSAVGFTNMLYDRVDLGDVRTTSRIITEFSKGPLMISLMGHGARDRFANDISSNPLFGTTDAAALNNMIYPVVAVWNCETASYYDADKTTQTLGEELVFNPNGGAIAFMGSTTQTTPPAQAHLAQNFFSQLSAVTQKPWKGTRLGDILYLAKIGTGTGNYEKDIVNSFTLIGDPSIKLPENLFPSSPYVPASNPTPVAAASQGKGKKGLFGCSAGAADGTDSSPWHEGLIEWLIYMGLIVFGIRKLIHGKSQPY